MEVEIKSINHSNMKWIIIVGQHNYGNTSSGLILC